METNPKKSIDSLKDQEIDSQNIKGGFTLIKEVDGVAHYAIAKVDYKHAAIQDAKNKGFKTMLFTGGSIKSDPFEV
jgi:hypothetical protein